MRKLSKELNLNLLIRNIEDLIDDWEEKAEEELNDWYNDSDSIFQCAEQLKEILSSYKRNK